ncbi:MAG: hypothetical protein NT136_04150 [Candidatus Moranbacteria bacterium]|nr:hypothetical protein [Candidatus Moranbacteria bacterium]
MLKKLIFTSLILAMAALVLSVSPVLAKNDDNTDDDWAIPEQNGVYDVPGHPNLKVRVFVHYPKVKETKPLQCSYSDPDSTAMVSPAGWELPAGEWKYYLNAGSAPSSVGSSKFSNLTNLSFETWQGTEINAAGVIFKNAGVTTLSKKALDGKNIVAFGSAPGSALGITYIWYYQSTGLAVETDTIMNKKFSWTWTPFSPTACPNLVTYDAQDILTHELGHWVGLDDEYTTIYRNNTMYGYGFKGEINKDTLTTGDIDGVTAIYQ